MINYDDKILLNKCFNRLLFLACFVISICTSIYGTDDRDSAAEGLSNLTDTDHSEYLEHQAEHTLLNLNPPTQQYQILSRILHYKALQVRPPRATFVHGLTNRFPGTSISPLENAIGIILLKEPNSIKKVLIALAEKKKVHEINALLNKSDEISASQVSTLTGVFRGITTKEVNALLK